MRILIVDTCYPAFLRAHYRARPGLDEQSYAQQWRALMDTFFGTADSYSHHLVALGHEAHEVIANAAPLQAAWLREHGVRARRVLERWRREAVVTAQAEDFRPDVVYVQNLHFLGPRTLDRLRSIAGSVVGQIASEPPRGALLRRFDLVLTSFPHFVETFRREGVSSEYFRLGFDERVLRRLEEEGAPTELAGAVFVGALNRRQHSTANALLERAARQAPIEFWGYGARGWPPGSRVRRDYRGEAWGLEMFRILRAARVALNRHIGVAGPFANNMRLYEATGVGTLLLTDSKQNLRELFEPGEEVVTYDGPEDLAEKIRYYLKHDEERRRIAAAGQARTLREHTYARRMKELVQILERALA